MNAQRAATIAINLRDSGLLTPDEWVEGKREPMTEGWTIEVWGIPNTCQNDWGVAARGAILTTVEECVAFSTMRRNRRIGARFQ